MVTDVRLDPGLVWVVRVITPSGEVGGPLAVFRHAGEAEEYVERRNTNPDGIGQCAVFEVE